MTVMVTAITHTVYLVDIAWKLQGSKVMRSAMSLTEVTSIALRRAVLDTYVVPLCYRVRSTLIRAYLGPGTGIGRPIRCDLVPLGKMAT